MRKNKHFWMTLSILILLLFGLIQINAQTIFQDIPEQIDSTQKFLFYLHGKIIEDQGINAVSEKFGAYGYEYILKKLANEGFVVISEACSINTVPRDYANKIVSQIQNLLNKKVPPQNITVVRASKGSGITIWISHLLKNEGVNFVIIAICNEQILKSWE